MIVLLELGDEVTTGVTELSCVGVGYRLGASIVEGELLSVGDCEVPYVGL